MHDRREKTALITFKDAAQQGDWEAQEQVVYCGLAKALNQQTISWVHGSKWAVSPIKATNGKTIADAIGGRVKTIQC